MIKKFTFVLFLVSTCLNSFCFNEVSSFDVVKNKSISNAYGNVKSSNPLLENKQIQSGSFIENKGQVKGFDGSTHPEVKFVYQKGDFSIFLLDVGLAYQFKKITYPKGYNELLLHNDMIGNFEKTTKLNEKIKTETFRIDMVLVGANPTPEIIAEDANPGYVNYYNHKALNVHDFNKITYKNVYPNIDWVIYSKEGDVKYDFIVHPGGVPDKIIIKYNYQEGLKINDDGSFFLLSKLGKVLEKSPVSCQGNKIVPTKFRYNNSCVSFDVDEYSIYEDLVIDPIIKWSTYYGDFAADGAHDCDTDNNDNVYLTGTTNSGGNIASGGYQMNSGGLGDAFLVKFNNSGVRQWATYYGGSGAEEGYSCKVDINGNVYLSGTTGSSVNISFNGHQNVYGGSGDAFLTKFSNNGSLIWSTYYGGNQNENGWCEVDINGDVYLSGATSSTNNISFNGHQNIYGGHWLDGYVVKFNSNGVRQWGTYYGGSSIDFGQGSGSTDLFGNFYLPGVTNSTLNIATGGHQNTYGGVQDAFLVKFNSSGVRQWATYYGGSDLEATFSSNCDALGNVYLTGHTSSTNNISFNGHQNTYGGAPSDAFIVKFNSNGIRQWATYYGGVSSNDEYGNSCEVDALGNVFFVGKTDSNSGIAIGGYQNSFGGGNGDGFLVKFNSSGIRQWSTYLGNLGHEDQIGCALNSKGEIYVCGRTSSIATFGAAGHQNVFAGATDAFLTKICDYLPAPASLQGNTNPCQGSTQTYTAAIQPNASSYTWLFPSGWVGTSTTNTISVKVGAYGTISVTANNACGEPSPSQTLAINVIPQPSITVNSGVICSGQSFTFNPSGAISYTYSSGSNVVSPLSNTTYSIYGTAANGCMTYTPATALIVVNPLPNITIASNEPVFCTSMNATLTASGANTYTWSGGPVGSSYTVSPLATTVYSVTGTDFNGCNNLATYTIVPNTTTSFNYSLSAMTVTLNITTTGCTSFIWDFGNGMTNTLNSNPVVTYNNPGVYGVCLKCIGLPNGCVRCINISVPGNGSGGIGIQELSAEEGVYVYPNPVQDELVVKVNSRSVMKLYGPTGQLILEKNLEGGESKLDLRAKAAGIYFMVLETNGKLYQTKVIKE